MIHGNFKIKITLRLVLYVLLTVATVSQAATAPTAAPWEIDADGFSDFSSCVASPATEGKTIIVKKPLAVNNLTVPANRGIRIIQGGALNVAAGKKLTINGRFQAGMDNVFPGSGAVTFGVNSTDGVLPQWFGMDVSSSDNATQISKAISSIKSIGGIVKIAGGGVYTSSQINISYANITILGDKRTTLRLKADRNTHLISSNAKKTTLKSLILDGNRYSHSPGATNRTNMILVVLDADECVVDDCNIIRVSRGAGIQASGKKYTISNNFFQDMGDSYADANASSDCIHVGVNQTVPEVGSYGTIIDNVFTNFTDYGVAVDGAHDVLIQNNKINFTTDYPFNAACGIGGGNGAYGISVIGNHIMGGGKLDHGVKPTLEAGSGVGQWKIKDNIVENARYGGYTLGTNAVAPSILTDNIAKHNQYAVVFNDQDSTTMGHEISGLVAENNSRGVVSYDSSKPLLSNVTAKDTKYSGLLNRTPRGVINNSPNFESTKDWVTSDSTGGGHFVKADTDFIATANAWKITGDGSNSVRGFLSQNINANRKLLPDSYYTLVVIMQLTGRIQGNVVVNLTGTGIEPVGVRPHLNSKITRYQTFFRLKSIPEDLQILIGAEGKPNSGFDARIYGVYLVEGINSNLK
jgi:hypothetical protein